MRCLPGFLQLRRRFIYAGPPVGRPGQPASNRRQDQGLARGDIQELGGPLCLLGELGFEELDQGAPDLYISAEAAVLFGIAVRYLSSSTLAVPCGESNELLPPVVVPAL